MKKAFTIIELIFVIILIGILSAVVVTSFRTSDDNLALATHETLQGIRYAQHLALSQHKFDPKDIAYKARGGAAVNYGKYFVENWQISFANNGFRIWSDANRDGAVSPNESAKKPDDGTDYFVDLSSKYEINSIVLSGGCAGANLIAFDRVGRPLSSLGVVSGYEGKIQNPCFITLKDSSGAKVIRIEPETGCAQIQ